MFVVYCFYESSCAQFFRIVRMRDFYNVDVTHMVYYYSVVLYYGYSTMCCTMVV